MTGCRTGRADRRWHALPVATDAPHTAADHRSDARTAALAAALLFAAVAVLGWLVHDHPEGLRLDRAGSRLVDSRRIAAGLTRHHLGRFDRPHFLERLVWFGSPVGVAVLVAALVVLAFVWRDRLGAGLAVAGPVVAEVVTEHVLKPVVHRELPNGTYAFPSGHATGVTAVVVVLLVLVYRRYGGAWALRALPIVALLVGVVGVALVRLHYHYLTDVVGGVGVGTATVLALAAAAISLNSRATTSDA